MALPVGPLFPMNLFCLFFHFLNWDVLIMFSTVVMSEEGSLVISCFSLMLILLYVEDWIRWVIEGFFDIQCLFFFSFALTLFSFIFGNKPCDPQWQNSHPFSGPPTHHYALHLKCNMILPSTSAFPLMSLRLCWVPTHAEVTLKGIPLVPEDNLDPGRGSNAPGHKVIHRAGVHLSGCPRTCHSSFFTSRFWGGICVSPILTFLTLCLSLIHLAWGVGGLSLLCHFMLLALLLFSSLGLLGRYGLKCWKYETISQPPLTFFFF